MFKIEDDVIYLTRGDDAEIEVSITDTDGTVYEMADGDVLTLTVRALPDAESPVVFTVRSDSTRIVITHADTADAAVGRYSADVQLTASGLRRTVWPDLEGSSRYSVKNLKNFVVMPEVTI